jgi:hypothetical protein
MHLEKSWEYSAIYAVSIRADPVTLVKHDMQ